MDRHRPGTCVSESLRVIVNAGGGRARREGARLPLEVERAFREAGAAAEVVLVGGEALAPAIRAGARGAVLAVGGGDGTQGLAAAVLQGSDTALAVLPLGTLNHFARQIGVPADLAGAARVALHGRRSVVDIGSVGDRVFVNNASLGIYTHLVRHRDAMRLPKALATLPAAFALLRRFRPRHIRVDLGDGARDIRTPLLFVGNNRYMLKGRLLGQRATLNDGVLSVFAVAPKSAWQLVGFGLRALIGKADPHRDFVALAEAERFTVLGKGHVDVAHDGEVTRMALPLTFRILPAALTVMAPNDH